jgi:hypothetical protein
MNPEGPGQRTRFKLKFESGGWVPTPEQAPGRTDTPHNGMATRLTRLATYYIGGPGPFS